MHCTFDQLTVVLDSLSKDIKNDLNYYLMRSNLLKNYIFIYDILYDKYSNPVFFLCEFKNGDISSLKYLHIYGFFGRYHTHEDCLQIESRLLINATSICLEVVKIHSGVKKRHGRGSLGLKFLEETIVPYVNIHLKSLSNSYKINYIYGISADLDDDTNSLARAKFYFKNEFEIINNHFYKYIS